MSFIALLAVTYADSAFADLYCYATFTKESLASTFHFFMVFFLVAEGRIMPQMTLSIIFCLAFFSMKAISQTNNFNTRITRLSEYILEYTPQYSLYTKQYSHNTTQYSSVIPQCFPDTP